MNGWIQGRCEPPNPEYHCDCWRLNINGRVVVSVTGPSEGEPGYGKTWKRYETLIEAKAAALRSCRKGLKKEMQELTATLAALAEFEGERP